MEIKEIKQKLHLLIDATEDKTTLIDLLNAAEKKSYLHYTNEATDLSEKDFKELLSLVNEPPEKDTISYKELKSSLSKWFTK